MEPEEDLEDNLMEKVPLRTVMVTIFESCDKDNTDWVQVSELINLIKPYFAVDKWKNLNKLHRTLDPKNENIYVNSERFYEVMGHWAKEVEREVELALKEDSDTSKSLVIEEDGKQLPFTHSTPNPSLGHKNVTESKDLLSLLDVSGYSLSTSQYEASEEDRTEEIKKLEYRMQKMFTELNQNKEQLVLAEEQNEILQEDVSRLTQKLHDEHQICENLRKEMQDNEKLREELMDTEAKVKVLTEKVLRFQRDRLYLSCKLSDTENQKTAVEKQLQTVNQQKNDGLEKLDCVIRQLEDKQEKLNEFTKLYSELQQKFVEQQHFIDELQEENRVLEYKFSTLEKSSKSNSFSTCLSLSEQLLSTSSDISEDYPTVVPPNESLQLDMLHEYSIPVHDSKQLRKCDQKLTPTPSNLKSPVLITQTSTLNNDAVILHFCMSSIGLNSEGVPESVEENIYFELKRTNMDKEFSNFEITRLFKKDQSEIDLFKFENKIFKSQFERAERQCVRYETDTDCMKNLYKEVALNAELTRQLNFANAKVEKLEKSLDELKSKFSDTIKIRVNVDRLQLAELRDSLGKNVELVLTSANEVQATEEEPQTHVQICNSKNEALAEGESRFNLMTIRNDNLHNEIVILDGTKSVLKLVFGKLKIEHGENNNEGDNINVRIENINQYQDSSVEASVEEIDTKNDLIERITTFEETVPNQLSKFNELVKSHEELKLANNHLDIHNKYLIENIQRAIEEGKQKDLEIGIIKWKLEETTNLNEELAESKYALEILIQDEIDSFQKLQHEFTQLKEINVDLIGQLRVSATKNQKLEKELREANIKMTYVNDHNKMLHQQLEEEKAQTKRILELEQENESSEIKLKSLFEQFKDLETLHTEAQADNDIYKEENNNLKLKLEKLQASCDTNRGKSYCQLETKIVTLQGKLEDLNEKYKREKTKNQKLETLLLSMKMSSESLEKIQQLIIEKQKAYDDLDMEFTKKQATDNEPNDPKDVLNQSYEKTTRKRQVSERLDRLSQSPLYDLEETSLNIEDKQSSASDSFMEIPLLDINCLMDNLLKDFSLDNGLANKSLIPDEEKNMTALSSYLLANSEELKEQSELHSEKYRCQYKSILLLIRDLVRSHASTGKVENIVQVYESLHKIKMQLNQLVQNASQVGASICEYREQPFRVLTINYMAALKENNEVRPRKNNSTQTKTGKIKLDWASKKIEEYIPKRRNKFCCCIITFIIILFAMALVLCIMLCLNYICRESVPESVSCPLDGILELVSNRKLPI